MSHANAATLSVSVPRYTAALYAVAAGLVFVHVALSFWHYEISKLPWLIMQLFNLDKENNLPTWFSGFILLNVAFFVFAYAQVPNRTRRRTWLLIAAGFLVLAIDEVAGLHETIHTAIAINWAIPAGILLLLLAAVFVPFLNSLPRRFAGMIILSGAIFVSGAIIIELISADLSSKSMTYAMHVAVEEGLEMFGALLFLSVLLHDMAGKQQNVDLTVEAHA